MSSIKVAPLQDDLPFGARITGVNWENVKDQAVRKQINDVFEQRGMIVFEDIEQSTKMQVEISTVFGELKDHPNKSVERVDPINAPGVIVIRNDKENSCIVEIEGKPLATWQPWHFDHCYNNELNRAGVLRAVQNPPNDGMTAFADGIQIYNDISPALRKKIERLNIIYTLDLLYAHQRFGLPKTFREIKPPKSDILEIAKLFPRAMHPAVWTRKTGEKVVHISPYMAVGIEGMETPEGEALFHEVWDEIVKTMRPYIHRWKPADMLIWDNWRMLHEACGCNPKSDRVMHRTTIKGDYGLGRFENNAKGPADVREMM
jgi:taurine dioxygenase